MTAVKRQKQIPCGNDKQGRSRFPAGMTSKRVTNKKRIPFGKDKQTQDDDGGGELEFDAALGEDAALVGVFDFAHLGDGVGELDEEGVGVAAGEDDVDHFGARL